MDETQTSPGIDTTDQALPASAVPVAKAGRRRRFAPRRPHVRTFDSLRERNFRLFWISTIGFGGGFWLHQLVIGWLTFDLTGSPLLTSLAVGLVELPLLVGAPIGGILADRLDRRRFMVATSGVHAIGTGAFGVLVTASSPSTWSILVYVLFMGTIWSLVEPSRVAIISNIVPKRSLVNAFALSMFGFNGARLAVPVIGGVIIALWGAGPALGFATAFHALIVATVLAMRTGQVRAGAKSRIGFGQLFESAKYVAQHRVVLALLLLSSIPPIFVLPFMQGLMPVYVSDVFGAGPTTLGFFFSALGVGALSGTFALASFGEIRRRGRVVLAALAVVAVSMAAFSQSPNVAVGLAIIIVPGAALPIVFTVVNATIQSIVPDELRGRTAALGAMVWGLFPVGSLMSGFLSEAYSVSTATLTSAVVVAVVAVLAGLFFREVWNYEQPADDGEDS